MNDILWHCITPIPVLIITVAIVLGLVFWSLLQGIHLIQRRLLIGGLRLLMLLILLIMIFQPQQQVEDITILRPQIAVIVDGSESMTDHVDDHQPTRAAKVIDWFHSSLEQTKKDFDVRVFTFDRSLSEQFKDPSQLKFTGANSFVINALNRVEEQFRGQPLAGILLLSDGIDTSGTDVASLATNIPVMSFELEKPFTQKEKSQKIMISGIDYPPRVFIQKETEIRVSLSGEGMSGRVVPVELWRDGKLLSSTPVAFNEDDQTRTAAFSITEQQPGSIHYEIKVNNPAADQEAHDYPFLIQAMDTGNRVIYLQNSLGFDFKFLRKVIVSDRNLQLSTFVRLSGGRIAMLDGMGTQGGGSLDFSPRSLGNCSVVIIGDLSPDALSEVNAQALRDFVDHGGALVLLGGTDLFTTKVLSSGPLAQLLPIELPAPYLEGKFSVRMTDTGLHHPVFGPLFSKVNDFPPLLSFNDTPGVLPSAEVLMQVVAEGGAKPLVVSKRFGQGHVVAVLSNTLWRWRLAASGWGAQSSPFDAFWIQLMDWLIPKEEKKQNDNRLELFTERSNYVSGEHPVVRAVIRTPTPITDLPVNLPLHIRTPDGKNFEYVLTPSTFSMPDGQSIKGYSVETDPNVPGVFVAESSITLHGEKLQGESRFIVGKPVTEITGKPINRELLKQMSEMSGGHFYTMENWNSWYNDLHYKQQKFSRIQLNDLWNTPFLVALLLALFCLEWICRKFWNLP